MFRWIAFWVGLLALAVILLNGCAGYPRFDPATCVSMEYGTDGPVLWQCA